MAKNEVYANGMELACKAGAGKTICAMPDVCFTPPENPATPPGVPVPYPNTGSASDTTEGSKTVKICDEEIMLKNKSYFKKSIGDEAGCAAKKGMLSSTNTGKVYFIKWSMDVKFEGENVDRHFDMTTDNHNSPNANEGVPWQFIDRMTMANIPGCEKQKQEVEDACGKEGENFTCPDDQPLKNAKAARMAAKTAAGKEYKRNNAYKNANKDVNKAIDEMSSEHKANDCLKKMRCLLSPYKPGSCCPGQTPHHLVEAGAFHDEGRGGLISKDSVKQVIFVKSMFSDTVVSTVSVGEGKVASRPVFGAEKYDQEAAPCICCEGESQNQGTHKALHQAQDRLAKNAQQVTNPNPFNPLTTAKGKPAKMQRLDTAIASGVNAVQEVFPESACDPVCIEAQLKEYHYNKAGMNPELPIKAVNGQGKALPAK